MSDYIAKNVSLLHVFPDYKDIVLEYNIKNKTKKYKLVSSYRTKQRLIDKIVNSYQLVTWGRGNQRMFIRMAEDMFIYPEYKQ